MLTLAPRTPFHVPRAGFKPTTFGTGIQRSDSTELPEYSTWCSRRDSNPRPSGCRPDALTNCATGANIQHTMTLPSFTVHYGKRPAVVTRHLESLSHQWFLQPLEDLSYHPVFPTYFDSRNLNTCSVIARPFDAVPDVVLNQGSQPIPRIC